MRNQKGVCMASLITTIIIMCIITYVQIDFVIGDNGLIEKAQRAATGYTEAQEEENRKLGGAQN